MTSIIELKNLTFNYKGKDKILEDINFKLEKAKITTILGENGSGKTTLFNVITNNLKNYEGDVIIDAKNIKKYNRKELAKKIAVVYQKNKNIAEFTVYEVISYGRIPHKNLFLNKETEEDKKKINFALEVTDLLKLKDKLVSDLSGGELQRVYIALALAQDTEIIILDEPTVYLDIKYQKKIMELLVAINKKYGVTILMILHDLNQALKYSDYVFIISDKKIINDGKKTTLLNTEILNKTFKTNIKKTKENILITW